MTAAFMVEGPRIKAPVVFAGRVQAVRRVSETRHGPVGESDLAVLHVFRCDGHQDTPAAATLRYYSYDGERPIVDGLNPYYHLDVGQEVLAFAESFAGWMSDILIGSDICDAVTWSVGVLRGMTSEQLSTPGADEADRSRQLVLYGAALEYFRPPAP